MRAKCRLEAEIKAKREAELRALAKLEKDREERGQADELAGAMHEFFAAVYEDDIAPEHLLSADTRASSFNELPLPSPDAITVTTEFGVMEEPANVTTISIVGPAPFPHAYDHFETEDNNVEMTEDLHEDLQTLQQGLAHMHLPTGTSLPPLTTEDDVNDTGEEADIDTDDFDADAESAFIEEFIDEGLADGVLTPTMTLAA